MNPNRFQYQTSSSQAHQYPTYYKRNQYLNDLRTFKRDSRFYQDITHPEIGPGMNNLYKRENLQEPVQNQLEDPYMAQSDHSNLPYAGQTQSNFPTQEDFTDSQEIQNSAGVYKRNSIFLLF